MRALTTILLLSAATSLAGCHLRHTVRPDTSCGLGIPYDRATAVPPIKAPDGLAQPGTRNLLKVPDIAVVPGQVAADAKRGVHTCLDEPPKFYADKRKPPPPPPAPQHAPPSND
jgi:uncharacterized lipoprotein